MNRYLSLMRIFSFPFILSLVLLNLLTRPSAANFTLNQQALANPLLHDPLNLKANRNDHHPKHHKGKKPDLRAGAAADFDPLAAIKPSHSNRTGSRVKAEKPAMIALETPISSDTNSPAVSDATSTDISSDWATYGFDIQRTGYNPKELNSKLNPSTVSGLHQLWATNLGEVTNAQPVYAHNVNVSGTSADIIYIGAEDGVFHAINAITGKQIWSRQLGTETTDTPTVSPGCGGLGSNNKFGITSTAVLDRGNSYGDRVYVVDGQDNVYALNLADGSIIWGPVSIGDPTLLHVYSALNVFQSNLYVTASSYCDEGNYLGGAFRISKIGTTHPFMSAKFLPTATPNGQAQVYGGGIWGMGGASIDPNLQNLYVAVGNALSDTENYGYSERVVSLQTDLTPISSNYPSGLYVGDSDFGATPILYNAPSTGCSKSLLAAENKSGTLHIYDRNNIQGGQLQLLQVSYPTSYGQFVGIPAFSPVTNYLYVSNPQSQGGYTNGMLAFQVQSDCTLNPTPAWQTTAGTNDNGQEDAPYSPPTVANGIVYMADGVSGDLFAFDAQNGGSPLFTVGNLGPAFSPPIVVDGRIYIGTYNNLYAFGL